MNKIFILSFLFLISMFFCFQKAEAKTLVMLHFDKAVAKDDAGNTWTAYGTPTISEKNKSLGNGLQLDGKSYLEMKNGITLGGQDFTIEGWAYIDPKCGYYGRIFEINASAQSPNRMILCKQGNSQNLDLNVNTIDKIIPNYTGKTFHFAYIYEHNKKLISLYLNGKLTETISATLNRQKYNLVYLGKSSWGCDGLFVGMIDEFKIIDNKAVYTSNFTPTKTKTNTKITNKTTKNNEKSDNKVTNKTTGNYLVELHFNRTATKDDSGNTWTAYGSPTISEKNFSFGNGLQLDGNSYLEMKNGITLGGQDFTIEGWAYIDPKCGYYGRIFELNASAQSPNRIILCKEGNTQNLDFHVNTIDKIIPNYTGKTFHFAYVYEHNKKLISLYLNGCLTEKIPITLNRQKYNILYLGKSSWGCDGLFVGMIDEFKIIDDKAVYTSNFAIFRGGSYKPYHLW